MIDFDVNGFIEKIQPAVDSFAQAMGTRADQLWTLGIAMERVKGGFMLFVALCAFITLCFVPKLWKWADSVDESDYSTGLAYWAPVITALIASGVFLACLYGGLIRMIVPQYALIMDIIRMMRAG